MCLLRLILSILVLTVAYAFLYAAKMELIATQYLILAVSLNQCLTHSTVENEVPSSYNYMLGRVC